MPFPKKQVEQATRHLRSVDPTLEGVIRAVGPFTLRTQSDRFRLLVRSIISQQISVSAARSILKRLEEALAPGRLTPQALAGFDAASLGPLGVSPQKASYLADLRDRALDGRLQLNALGRMEDESVIEQLRQVRGIGRWTAQMFLIFGLGRWDILPHDDLGLQTALRRNYRLRRHPARAKIERLANPWRPYRSIAVWYLWQSLDPASAAGEKP